MGESLWRQAIFKGGDEERIGNCSTEAFAHTLLRNNYFAWLYNMKQSYAKGEFKTEYDTQVSTTARPVIDSLLEGIEICPAKLNSVTELT